MYSCKEKPSKLEAGSGTCSWQRGWCSCWEVQMALVHGAGCSMVSICPTTQPGSVAKQGDPVHTLMGDDLGILGALWCWGSSSFPLNGRVMPGIGCCPGELCKPRTKRGKWILALHTELVGLSSQPNTAVWCSSQSAIVESYLSLEDPWKKLYWNEPDQNICQSRFPLEYITSTTWWLPTKNAPEVLTSFPTSFSEHVNPQPPKATHLPMFPQSTKQNICKALC